MNTLRRHGPRIAAWAAVLMALALVFISYLDPHLMVDLANRVWACF
ncbi:MAG: hypothetical protein KA711_01075 [Ideonella sp. WA131b]|jgi:hypothetical protein|nr:hypothetical protein [Ideonella sp. WA131b]